MIEVLFGESETATMRILKENKAVYLSNKKKKQYLIDKDIFGSRQEALCLAFMLDIGDIDHSVESDYRYKLIQSFYFQKQWEEDEKNVNQKEEVNVYLKELNRLKSFLNKGEKIRIWYSDAPYSRCGLYWICQILEQYKNEIYAVKLPEYFICDNGVATYENWNEAPEKCFLESLSLEKRLTQQDILYFASQWNELVNEHSLLRAYINGKMIGVPEDFYDFQIWKYLKDKPIIEADLIGKIMIEYQNSMADWWYAKRIQYYIDQKKIDIIKDSKSHYSRMICCDRYEQSV